MHERLKQIRLFADLPEDDLARLVKGVEEHRLEAGEMLFAEGDPGDSAYFIASGQLEVVKATERREVLLALRGPGEVIGEMALLQEEPRMASVRARSDAELLAIPKAVLDDLLETSPSAARAMFQNLLARWRETQDALRHNERMAQLGTLTAGVAHELNNPAAAVKRAAERLKEDLDALASQSADGPLGKLAAAAAQRSGDDSMHLDALTRSDVESDIEEWLEGRGVEQPWRLAAAVVDAGITLDDLREVSGDVDADSLRASLVRLLDTLRARALAGDISAGTRRISTIVGALKSYSYLDQAPVQEVDVVRGIEETLTILAHKIRGIDIVREFDAELPGITAYGSELNQVWTNLIDNAADALTEANTPDPTITLRAYPQGEDIVVEVEDNGPGIPEDRQGKIFDAFFTTKPPGRGTGLGLQISNRIVVLQHRGELSVDSEPGKTTFRVVIPIHQPDAQSANETTSSEPEDDS